MSKIAIKYITDKRACCHDCMFEYTGRLAESEAKKHALATGHIPTLEVAYDVAAFEPN
jgi:hypothetical protein